MKKIITIIVGLIFYCNISAQINTDRVTIIGRNALYYEDYVLAIQYFNQVINAKPHLAAPYYYRAIAKYCLDDMKGAEDDCTLALTRNQFITKAYQLRADARQHQTKYDDALEDYKVALDNNPNDKFSLVNLGIVHILKKEYDDAETALNRLLQIHPAYHQGYLTRAALHTEAGDTIKAFDDYNHAIELDKYFAQSYSMRGLLYYHVNKYDSALVDLNEAISLDPLAISNYINRGLIKYTSNDLRGAMSDYDRVIDAESNNTIARFNRGLLRAQVGDNNNAIADFDNVLKFEPNNYMALYNRALLKNNINDYKGAIEDMDYILEKYPDYFNGYYARAEIKRKNNDLRGSERDYNMGRNMEANVLKNIDPEGNIDKTREESDDNLDKFNLLVVADKDKQEKSKYTDEKRGRVQNRNIKIDLEPRFILTYYEKTNEFRQRIYYSKLMEEINNNKVMPKVIRMTNNETALTSLQIDEHFESINNLSHSIEKDTLNAVLYFARAIDFMLIQDFQSAIEDLSKATKINPTFTLAYFSQAVIYSKQMESKIFDTEYELLEARAEIAPIAQDNTLKGTFDSGRLEYDMILRNYNKVIELNPEFAYAYYNRGALKYKNGDYRGAIIDYNEAIRHNRDFTEAYYNRGLARLQIRDTEKALEDMRKAGEGGIVSAYGIIKRMTE